MNDTTADTTAREWRATGRDALAVAALARGMTRAEAAAASGWSERTVTRRMGEPAFRAAVERERAALVEQAAGRLADSLDAARVRLVALLDSPHDHVALAAARAVLDFALRYREAADTDQQLAALAARLDALERAA